MSEITHMAEAIEAHFTHPEPSSFLHFVVVSDGLTGEEAARVPGQRFNSIWAITNHMAFWMDYTRAALLDQDVDLASWGLTEVGPGWPPIGEVSDANWQSARQRALDICHTFAAAIRAIDPAKLEQPTDRLFGGAPYQAMRSMYGHNCYHTGELLTVRHMLGLWVDHEWA